MSEIVEYYLLGAEGREIDISMDSNQQVRKLIDKTAKILEIDPN